MVSIPQRMRKLHSRLLAIRCGPGALILPKEIKRINLRFAQRIEGGHMGARKLWRNELVRLAYHNPSLPITIDRTALATDPSTLSIHYGAADDTSSSSSSSPEQQPETIRNIDMTRRTNSEILAELQRVTQAYPVEPTAEDTEQMRALEEQRVRSEADSKLAKEVRARQQREKRMLEQARGEIAAQPA